jgi:hypothetical protein
MSRKKTITAEAGTETVEGPVTTATLPPAESPQVETAPEKSHAAGIEKKKYTPAPDPFGTEGIKAGDNHLQLLQSKADRAWVIRFDKNPSEGVDADGKEYSKDHKHPVIAYLKSEGYRWGFADADGKGGWGKPMEEGHYTYAEHMDAQRVFRKAAEMVGAGKDHGIPF